MQAKILLFAGRQRLERAEAEDRVLLAQRDEAPHPAQQRRRRAQLRLDVDGLIAVDGVHERRRVELGEVRAREAAVAVARPLHRRAHAVAVAEVDVVAHRDLVAVVEDRRARQAEEHRVQQLDLVAAAVHERREPPADADVELHPRVLRVLGVHVVALLVGDHLERQLVVVAQEQAPLAVDRDVRRLGEDLEDRRGLLAAQAHEHPRHDGEVEGHVALVAVAEVVDDVGGPLVGLGEQHPVGVLDVDDPAHLPEERVRLLEVLAVRALALVEVGHGVEAKAVEAEVQPEAQDVEHRLADLGVVVVEVGLVMEEAMPVVGAGLLVPRPVRRLGVDEDDPRARSSASGRPTRRTSRAWGCPGSSAPPETTRSPTTCGS